MLRPKTVQLVGKGTPETCACMHCLHVRLKIGILNKVLQTNLEELRLPSETKMLSFFLCGMDSEWPNQICLEALDDALLEEGQAPSVAKRIQDLQSLMPGMRRLATLYPFSIQWAKSSLFTMKL
ncbi:hypothetical protein PoB_006735900 [Plakobranchus ocellatus]|uniref:Uncharacterized protein n=1 Tax=Plakobranchus ocellatus TaxID=259542 RepID=A0AAV4D9F1_9GAST|nr:hypothetical protein PoB_006735900 [Plakobranchus ocellatus]